jgi:hypothetical protein
MSLQVFVNGLELVNGPIHRLNIRETTGLWDPAALVEPGTVETFEGPFRVRQTTVDYGVREITIVGSLYIASVSYADKLRALDWLQGIYAPRPSRVVVGSLELLVDFGKVQIQADELKRLNGTIRYQVTGTAVPATFSSSVSAGTGYVQGLAVDTARVNEAATLATMASGVGTITVLGDAPTPAVITIQGAVSTTYYLATSSTGRRVPITTDANGVGRIDERSGFYLAPGVNRITAYNAATGTTILTTITVMSLFGTTWRFTGNAPAGNVTRYDLGPALTVNRTGSARYFLGNTNPASGGTNGIVTAGDDEPRIGWSWLNRRNLFIDSNDLSSSTSTTRTGIGTNIYQVADPDGGLRAYRAISNSADASIGYGTAKLTSGAVVVGVEYTFSVWLRSTGSSNTIRAYIYDSTSSTMTSWTVTSTWTRFSVTRTVANTSGFAFQVGGGSTWSSGEGIEIYGPQFEVGASASDYQATDANGIAIDHPANAAGLVLEGLASNLCLYSEDQSNAAWVKGAGGVTSNAAVAPDGTTTADRLLFSSPFDASTYQIITGLSASANNYTWSAWVKATTGTVAITMQVQTVSAGVPTGTDVFTDVVTTVGTNWTRIAITGSNANTSIALLLSAGASFDVWGSQLELGTAATSYIPTTTASIRREADICGVVNPHNLLLYSEPISQGTIGAATTPWQVSTWTAASSSVDSPQGTDTSTLLNVSGSATQGIYQDVTIPGGVAGKTYTFSIWIRNNVTTASVAIRIMNQLGAATVGSPVTCSFDATWRRFSVSATMGASDTAIRVRIDTYNSSGSILVFGAQLTEGYLPGRYVRTTDTQVLPTTAIDPSWSQNGYIEFDAIWAPRASGLGEFLGDTATGDTGGFFFRTDKSGNWVVFSRRDTGNTNRNVLYTSATVHDRGYGKIRAEWTNYTLSGSRYMFMRIYIDGVLGQEINYAGTAGTAWPVMSMTRLSRMAQTTSALGSQGTISNLTIGVPALPQGAVPAGI